jgi:hypothetical protein
MEKNFWGKNSRDLIFDEKNREISKKKKRENK